MHTAGVDDFYALVSHLGLYNFFSPELLNHCPTVTPGRVWLLIKVLFSGLMIYDFLFFFIFLSDGSSDSSATSASSCSSHPFNTAPCALSPCRPPCSMHSRLTWLPCPGSPSPQLTRCASVPSLTSSVNAAMLYACRIILSQYLWGLYDCMVVSRIESLDFFPSQWPFLASITVDHHVDK